MRKRRLQIGFGLIIILVLLIGGYAVMKQKNTPDTPAFNHDFTKGFLVKDAEAPEGYHLFESGTEKYTMLFPESYYMSEGSYYRKKGNRAEFPDTENVFIRQEGISPKGNGMIKGINLFLKPDANVVVDSRLRGILRKINAPENTNINEWSDDNKTIYYVENTHDYTTENQDINRYFYYYGFIADNNSEQALYFELRHACFHVNENECKINFEQEKTMGLEMMKSVKFRE